jgi:hypothetical protein
MPYKKQPTMLHKTATKMKSPTAFAIELHAMRNAVPKNAKQDTEIVSKYASLVNIKSFALRNMQLSSSHVFCRTKNRARAQKQQETKMSVDAAKPSLNKSGLGIHDDSELDLFDEEALRSDTEKIVAGGERSVLQLSSHRDLRKLLILSS